MSDSGSVEIRPLRCPRCRQPPRRLIEFGTVCSSFEVRTSADGNSLRRDEDGWHSYGDITRLEAECRGGHRWKVRGAIQVTDVDAVLRSRRA